MQKSASSSTTASAPNAGTASVFRTNLWSSSSNSNHSNSNFPTTGSRSRSRPTTSSSERDRDAGDDSVRDLLHRRPSFGLRPSTSSSNISPSRPASRGGRRRSTSNAGIVTDAAVPPALPEFALAAAAKVLPSSAREGEATTPHSGDSFSKMLGRAGTGATSVGGGGAGGGGGGVGVGVGGGGVFINALTANGFMSSAATGAIPPPIAQGPSTTQPTESSILFQHIQDIANKRISTLDYLRKAHEGRVYWFNTLMFDKSDITRMPYYEPRKLARRATNYLLLGLSLPTCMDLNSATPSEFLRSINTLLTEFESYQAIHTESGINASSLSRTRLPQMFRRGQAGKARRTSGAGDQALDTSIAGSASGGGPGDGGIDSNSVINLTPTSVISFGHGTEANDLIPGEEYTHLLTPSLPFDPDFFETFATLCDVLIDAYVRLLALLPHPRECTPAVAELFTKADARLRKIIIQGVVKEFEDSSRQGLKTEVANVGKAVLGGLM